MHDARVCDVLRSKTTKNLRLKKRHIIRTRLMSVFCGAVVYGQNVIVPIIIIGTQLREVL